jgi:hypothetical protein
MKAIKRIEDAVSLIYSDGNKAAEHGGGFVDHGDKGWYYYPSKDSRANWCYEVEDESTLEILNAARSVLDGEKEKDLRDANSVCVIAKDGRINHLVFLDKNRIGWTMNIDDALRLPFNQMVDVYNATEGAKNVIVRVEDLAKIVKPVKAIPLNAISVRTLTGLTLNPKKVGRPQSDPIAPTSSPETDDDKLIELE